MTVKAGLWHLYIIMTAVSLQISDYHSSWEVDKKVMKLEKVNMRREIFVRKLQYRAIFSNLRNLCSRMNWC